MRRRSPDSGSASLGGDELIVSFVAGVDSDGVLAWRFEQLLAAGYEGRSAARLARDRAIDLHVAVALLERGCPVETALRILL